MDEKLNLFRDCGDSCREKLFKEATDFAFFCRQHHDTLFEAIATSLRAGAFWDYSMADKAITEQEKAVSLFLRADNIHALEYNTYLLGYYMFNSEQYKEALPYFLKAYKLTLQTGDKYMLEETSGWIGNTYNALKKFDSAIYYRYISLNYAKNSKMDIGNGLRYLGNIYENMGAYDSAVAVYERSINLFVALGNNPLMEKYFVATVYYKQGKYALAAKSIDELLDPTKNYKNPLINYLATQIGGNIYDKAGEPQKAIQAFRKYIKLNDSIQKEDKSESITEMNAKMQFGQTEKIQQMEVKQQKNMALKDRQREAIIRNVLITGMIGILIFATILYRYFLQKKKANILLAKQKMEIEYQKKEIEDSINYANRIQATILPDREEIEQSFANHFILYKPKNVVSGDFYWHAVVNGVSFIAAADCTGHGVPGAFMSMIGNDKLNLIVKRDKITEPAQILKALNVLIKEALHQNRNSKVTLRDGMDLAIIRYECDGDGAKVTYAGANRPLYLVRNGTFEEIKPTKAPIGGYTPDEQVFEEHHLSLKKGDGLYLCSDGIADQFGGEKSKKFTSKRLKNAIASYTLESVNRQKELLELQIVKCQGKEEQVDDILLIGIKV